MGMALGRPLYSGSTGGKHRSEDTQSCRGVSRAGWRMWSVPRVRGAGCMPVRVTERAPSPEAGARCALEFVVVRSTRCARTRLHCMATRTSRRPRWTGWPQKARCFEKQWPGPLTPPSHACIVTGNLPDCDHSAIRAASPLQPSSITPGQILQSQAGTRRRSSAPPSEEGHGFDQGFDVTTTRCPSRKRAAGARISGTARGGVVTTPDGG